MRRRTEDSGVRKAARVAARVERRREAAAAYEGEERGIDCVRG